MVWAFRRPREETLLLQLNFTGESLGVEVQAGLRSFIRNTSVEGKVRKEGSPV